MPSTAVTWPKRLTSDAISRFRYTILRMRGGICEGFVGPQTRAIDSHSDVTTTLGIYAHSMSEDRLAAQDDMLAAMMTPSNAVN
jgi:hypothetical protein